MTCARLGASDMSRKRYFLLVILFGVAVAYPSDISDGSGSSGSDIGVTFSDDFEGEDVQDDGQRRAALEKLQQIFGIPEQSQRYEGQRVPPQFMMELYNTVADPSGVTRGRNPYDAKVVRSFIERDASMAHYYLFNITGMDVNESVLEAELHLYRKKTPLTSIHPAILSSPYYVIRVYQVLDERQLDTPDLHRLLNVHYVGAHASGWQVFNVKQAVLSWVSGVPNRGLLVTASNVFGDDVAVHFSRRTDHHRSKQPILVLFNDDGKENPPSEGLAPRYYKYANDVEEIDETEEEDEEKSSSSYRDHDFRQEKSTGARKSSRLRRESSAKKMDAAVVSKRSKIGAAMTSMDIYERALTREKLREAKGRAKKMAPSSYRKRRFAGDTKNRTECARHELYVNFSEIGWSDYIIAPEGYAAYHCNGHCDFPLSQSQNPTNHATVQSTVHMLLKPKNVQPPCCVPTKLLSSSVLYFEESENVVLKRYQDMVADRCGCH